MTSTAAVASHTPAAALARHLPGLDGLRGIAILCVIPHNLNLFGTAAQTAWDAHLLGSVLDRGWIGVQLFFVLSGFLITGILLDTRERTRYFTTFFARRVLRILPLYYVMLTGVFVVLPAFNALPSDMPRYSGSEWSYWFFYSNWYGPFHLGEGSMPHLWSLAVEEQFYLAWPVLMYRCSPRCALRLCLGISALSVASRVGLLMQGATTETIYSFLICRMDALSLGGAAAAALRVPVLATQIRDRQQDLLWIALGVIVVGAVLTRGYMFSGAATLTWGYLTLAVAFALIVAAAACGDSGPQPRRGFLRMRWLQEIGRRSYAMYLLHVPLHVIVGPPLAAQFLPKASSGATQCLVYVVGGTLLSYIAALLAFWTIETHADRLKRALSRHWTAKAPTLVRPG